MLLKKYIDNIQSLLKTKTKHKNLQKFENIKIKNSVKKMYSRSRPQPKKAETGRTLAYILVESAFAVFQRDHVQCENDSAEKEEQIVAELHEMYSNMRVYDPQCLFMSGEVLTNIVDQIERRSRHIDRPVDLAEFISKRAFGMSKASCRNMEIWTNLVNHAKPAIQLLPQRQNFNRPNLIAKSIDMCVCSPVDAGTLNNNADYSLIKLKNMHIVSKDAGVIVMPIPLVSWRTQKLRDFIKEHLTIVEFCPFPDNNDLTFDEFILVAFINSPAETEHVVTVTNPHGTRHVNEKQERLLKDVSLDFF